MKRLTLPAIALMAILVTSCVSKKKYTALSEKYQNSQAELYQTRTEKEACETKLAKIEDRVSDYYAKINSLQQENKEKLEMTGEGAVVSQNAKEAMRETLKNVDPAKLAQAQTLGDSLDLAVSYNLQQSFSGDSTDGIQVHVENTIVEITISDDLLFRSSSYRVNRDAYDFLERIAQVVKSEPAMEVMVEGHTDSRTFVKGSYIKDNWGLSVRRAVSVVRILQNKFGIDGEQLIASGRSSYHPIASNDTAEGRQQNRRTRIIILPNLDKFLALLDSSQA